MVELNVKGLCEQIDKNNIRELEEELEMNFPESYREFLHKYNGGRPSFKGITKNRAKIYSKEPN